MFKYIFTGKLAPQFMPTVGVTQGKFHGMGHIPGREFHPNAPTKSMAPTTYSKGLRSSGGCCGGSSGGSCGGSGEVPRDVGCLRFLRRLRTHVTIPGITTSTTTVPTTTALKRALVCGELSIARGWKVGKEIVGTKWYGFVLVGGEVNLIAVLGIYVR